jgi:mono/diheme cytochrome c family protein
MSTIRKLQNSARHAGWTATVILVSAVCSGGERQVTSDTGAAAEYTPVASTQAPVPPQGATSGGAGSGEQLYQRCVTCHQANGQGLAGAFPPLAGSEYATANKAAVPIQVVLHGLQGPITVKGAQYNGVMPAYGTGIEMSDDEVAAVLTYVRTAWGNKASAITAQQVAAERERKRSTSGAMTAAELKSLM